MADASLRTFAATAVFFAIGCTAARATTMQLCNATKGAVEFALGYSEPGTPFVTKGWWPAQPGKCSEPIPRGKTGVYYLHIKKVSGGSVEFGAGSKHALVCASLSQFTDRPRDHRINGKLDCPAGGLVTLKFIKFEMSRADLQDVLRLESNGTIRISNGAADLPKIEERAPPPPVALPKSPKSPEERVALPPSAAPQKKPPPPEERAAPPSDTPPKKSQTPDACKRYPSLC